MPEINLAVQDLSPEKLSATLDAVEKALGMMSLLAALTPTTFDDRAVAVIRQVLAAVKPWLARDGSVDLLNLILSLLARNNGDPKAVLAEIQK